MDTQIKLIGRRYGMGGGGGFFIQRLTSLWNSLGQDGVVITSLIGLKGGSEKLMEDRSINGD